MSNYSNWYGYRRGRNVKPEDFFGLLLILLILSFFYPPLKPVIASLWYVYILSILVLLVFVVKRFLYLQKLSKAGIYKVDQMTGKDFEMFLHELFSRLGYKVIHTGRIGDLGSDLIIEKDGIRMAVQAKRYRRHVGPDAVREVTTVIKPRDCKFGMVVTNSFYTREARVLAKSNNITLWDRNNLVNNIIKSQKQQPL